MTLDRYCETLTLHDLPEPDASPSDVVVEINASSVNRLDEKLRRGVFMAILTYKMPLVLGHDLAGTIVAVGGGVKRWQISDKFFSCVGGNRIGTFAERVAVTETDLAHMPANLDPVAAAALPLVTLTAWQALVERAKIRAGQRVFIHAVSGAVAIQLAKLPLEPPISRSFVISAPMRCQLFDPAEGASTRHPLQLPVHAT